MKKIKTSLFIYCIFFVLLTIFRSLQLNFAIDPITGFTQVGITDAILYGFLLLFSIFVLFYVYRSKEAKAVISQISFSFKLTPYIVFLYSVIIILTCTLNINSLKIEYIDSMENMGLIVIFIFKVVATVIGFLSGFLLFVEVFKSFIQKVNYKVSAFACFVAIIHSILSLLTFFIKERTLVTISQNLLTLFFWIFAVQFIFAFCRYLCSSKIGKPFEETFSFSMITSILGSVTIISPIFAKEQLYYSMSDSERLITIPIFLLATSISVVNIIRVFKKN